MARKKTKNSLNLDEIIAGGANVHLDLGQDVLITTEDKMKLYLIEYDSSRFNKTNWEFPTGIFVGLFSTTVVADFPDTWAMSGAGLHGFFICLTLVSAAFAGYCLYQLKKEHAVKQTVTHDQVISSLKEYTARVKEIQADAVEPSSTPEPSPVIITNPSIKTISSDPSQ